MKTFHEFVWLRMPTGLLLREISELFPKRGIQDLFDREVQRLREKTDDQEALRHLDEFSRIDVVGYLDSSLRRSGVHPNELDSLVQDLSVKLLMGSFFRGWTGQSLVARFKVAVRNAISSLRSRSAKKRKRQEDLPDDVAARPQPDESLIADFRNFLRLRFGETPWALRGLKAPTRSSGQWPSSKKRSACSPRTIQKWPAGSRNLFPQRSGHSTAGSVGWRGRKSRGEGTGRRGSTPRGCRPSTGPRTAPCGPDTKAGCGAAPEKARTSRG